MFGTGNFIYTTNSDEALQLKELGFREMEQFSRKEYYVFAVDKKLLEFDETGKSIKTVVNDMENTVLTNKLTF